MADVPLELGRTFYTGIGDTFGWLCLLAAFVLGFTSRPSSNT